MKRRYGIQRTLGVILITTVFACTGIGCGDDGADPVVTDGDQDTDTELTEEETEQEALPDTSKCGEGYSTNNPIDLLKRKGGIARVCEVGEPLDGTQVLITREADSDYTLEIKEGTDLTMEGYRPIGPAVLFDAEGGLSGNVTFILPFDATLLDEGIRDYTINVVAKPKDGPVRFVPKTQGLLKVRREEGLVEYTRAYFGTYQVMVPITPNAIVTRHITYRALAGVSMGGGGTSFIGTKHPDQFDSLGMMGGPIDLTYQLKMIRQQLMAGFCTLEELTDDGTVDGNIVEERLTDPMYPCGVCMDQPSAVDPGVEHNKCFLTPPSDPEGLEHPNGYNHWNYDDQAGAFDREEYIALFRDLNLAFGNSIGYNPESPYLPAGVPIDAVELGRNSPGVFCDPDQLTPWMSDHGHDYPFANYYDDEYNPKGSYPVILFCDGGHETGDFDPDLYVIPVDIAVAVDYNGNGIRDFGEPVIRNTWEPFEDCGTDRLCNVDEPGYDADTNPDPNGDDFHYIDNPGGTEGNLQCDGCDTTDGGEKWYDFGLDGVENTPQYADGGYDWGEGNGVFDLNPNVKNGYYYEDGHKNIEAMTDTQIAGMNFWMDGGVRDIFNFGVNAFSMYSMLLDKLGPDYVGRYNWAGEMLDPPISTDNGYDFLDVDYGKLGRHVLYMYGDPNATPETIMSGDGRHLGTNQQVVNRVLSFLAYAAYYFPKGNFDPVPDYDPNNMLEAGYFPSVHMGENRRYSISLPPGYEENPDLHYPVVYLMHGYGMEPQGMASMALIIMPYMAEGKVPKMIMVFPDGKCESESACISTCRNVTCQGLSGDEEEQCKTQCITDCEGTHRECVKGTFYVNHKASYDHLENWDDTEHRYGQIEDYTFDLIDYVDSNYRTMPAEDLEVDAVTGEWAY